MTGAQKAIFPGILLSSLFLIFLNQMVHPLKSANAATEIPDQAVGEAEVEEKEGVEEGCVYLKRYPGNITPWCELIETQAAKFDVDPLLVAVVMLVESGGQPEVISHSGAVGLMQIMPRDGIASTFQCINGPCFANRPTIEELKAPEFNVEYGVRMLAGLFTRYGNARDALKAYGPADVDYWYADKVLEIYADY